MSEEARGLKEERKKVLFNAFLMASGTMTSRVLGLLRDMALASLFDRTITDAWTAAFRVPNLFRRLFGEGSLSVSFIPVFIEAQGADFSGRRADNLLNSLYTLLLVFLAALTLAGLLAAGPMMNILLDESYHLIPGKFELTVRLAQIMFGFVFFICTYAYFMGILNALGSFALPALAPSLFNLSMLGFIFLPSSWFAQPGDNLAWGVLVGGMAQMLLLWITLKARGYLPSFSFQWRNSDLSRVLVNMLPGLMGIGLLQLTTLVNLRFASQWGEGALSYVYWADRLLELPLSLVSVSLGAALLPRLSELWSAGKKPLLARTLTENFLVNVYLSWPAALGLFLLAEPIVTLLFHRGEFSVADVKATASLLRIYAGMLVFIASSRILVAAYYAAKNTKWPAVMAALSLGGHIILAPSLMQFWDLEGMVLSSLLTTILNFSLLLFFLPSQVTGLLWAEIRSALAKMAAAGGILFALVYGLGTFSSAGSLNLLVTIVLGAGTYALMGYVLRIPQFDSTFMAFWRRYRRNNTG